MNNLQTTEVNRYQRSPYTQGGKPHDISTGILFLYKNGEAILEEGGTRQKMTWSKRGRDQIAVVDSKGNVDLYITYENRLDTLFSFGSQLQLIGREAFPLHIEPLVDNPVDPLNSLVQRLYPGVRRLSCRRDEMLDVMPKGGVMAEIGVNFGNFAMEVLFRTKPKCMHLIDCWQGQSKQLTTDEYSDDQQKKAFAEVKSKFKTEIDNGAVVMNRGFSRDEMPKFHDHYFDWVYIDASHRYEDCIADLYLCEAKVKRSGLIAGHDYCNSPLARSRGYGVLKAVNEFCEREGWKMIYLTIEHPQWPYQSYVLQRKMVK